MLLSGDTYKVRKGIIQKNFFFRHLGFPFTHPVFCRSKLLLAKTSRPGGRSYKERC